MAYSSRRRNQLILQYFLDGYTYSMILVLLGLLHGISLSMSQLKRILRRMKLRRQTNMSHAHLQRVEALIRVSFWITVQQHDPNEGYDQFVILLRKIGVESR